MALMPRRDKFAPPPGAFEQQLIPVVSVMLGTLMTLLPMITTAPMLPPLGFLMLLAWRLLRNDLWPVWAALPLGAFDDLFSGAPIGTATALWTITFVAIDAIDRRFVWRDHKQDWGIAAVFLGLYLVSAAWMSGAIVPMWVFVPQFVLSMLLFPLLNRTTATLDRWRLGR